MSVLKFRLDLLRVTITEGLLSEGPRSFATNRCNFPSSAFSLPITWESNRLTGTETGMMRGTRLLSSRALLGADEEPANSTTLLGAVAATSLLFISSEVSGSFK